MPHGRDGGRDPRVEAGGIQVTGIIVGCVVQVWIVGPFLWLTQGVHE
jgi:tetrahydromethanopterin S-methyltransferase subunit F